jgi:hypothetical protein
MSAFKVKANSKNSGPIILKSWDSSSKPYRKNLKYVQEKYCQDLSGVKSEQGYAALIDIPTVQA